jgi:hypothetical protein
MKPLNLIKANKMKIFYFLLISNLLIATDAFAHGEDKYGPNMGYIRMPGSFHTEVVPEKDGSYRVFLIDLQNKKPTITDSSVEFQIKDGNKVTTFNCMPMQDTHFHCTTDEKKHDRGQIIIKAKRLGIQARDAVYDLPLKLKNAKNSEEHDMTKMDMKK